VVDGGTTNAGLVGKYLPQVPMNRGSLRAVYANPKYATVAFSIQFYGLQYDDDQNVRGIPAPALSDAGYTVTSAAGLPAYHVADLSVARAITRNIEAFFGMQNMFDRTYFVGTLPTTIGSPRLVNVGARVRFSGR